MPGSDAVAFIPDYLRHLCNQQELGKDLAKQVNIA